MSDNATRTVRHEAESNRPLRSLALSLLTIAALGSSLSYAQIGGEDDSNRVIEGAHTGTLFAVGQPDLQIGSSVDGDVFAAGRRVRLLKTAGDHLFAAAGRVDFVESQGNDLTAAAAEVIVDAKIAGNVLIAGGRVRMKANSSVGGDALAIADRINYDGEVLGDVKVLAREVTIRGTINGDVLVRARRLYIEPGASVNGKISYHGPQPPQVADTANINGELEHFQTGPAPDEEAGPLAWVLKTTLALGLLSLVVHAIWPRLLTGTASRITARPWASLGMGVGLLLAVPFVVVKMGITGIALPTALTLLVLYLALLLPSILVTACFLGGWAWKLMRRQAESADSLWMKTLLTCVGVFALALLASIPGFGILAGVLTISFGLGALVFASYDREAVS